MIGPSAELLRFALAAVLVSPAAVVLPATAPLVLVAFAVLAVAVARDFAVLRREPRLAVERRLPRRSRVGCVDMVEIVVTNGGERTVHVDVVEEVPRSLRGEDPVFPALALAPGETRTVHYAIEPAARGEHMLGRLHLLRRSALGLLERRESAAGAVVHAWPDAARFLRGRAADRREGGRAGVRPTRQRGQGSELDALREYVPGDDTRRIVWGASARRGHPVVRLDRHERNHPVWIAIDTSRLMGAGFGGRTRLDLAIDVGLALAGGALASQDRVGMLAFDAGVHARLGPLRRRTDLGAFVTLLQPLQARPVEPDYRGLVRTMLRGFGHRALVFVLSDFTESDEDAVIASLGLLARRHRVVLVGLRDPVLRALDAGADLDDADGLGLYRRLVVADLLDWREKVAARLRRAGVDVIDATAAQVSARVLDRYRELRHGPDR